MGLNAQSTDEQYRAESDLPRTVADVTPAEVPNATLVDLSADWTVLPHIRLLASVDNLSDKRYYSRVFFVNCGIEPARRRSFQAGEVIDF